MDNVDLSGLQNISELNLGLEVLNDSASTIQSVIDAPVNADIGSFWFTSSISVFWMVLIWIFYKKDQNFQLDISRAILTSSGWSFFISAGFLLGGLTQTIYPIIWFSTLIVLSWLSVRSLQSKGL